MCSTNIYVHFDMYVYEYIHIVVMLYHISGNTDDIFGSQDQNRQISITKFT